MSADTGCLLVLTSSLSVIFGLVLGFGFHDFLANRIDTWLPPSFDDE